MKTAQWIDLLAQSAGPAPQRLVLRRLAPVAALRAPGSTAIAVAWLGWVRAEMFLTAAPRLKLACAAALAASAGWLTARLARPVARLAAPLRAVMGVVVGVALAVGLLGALAWATTPAPLRQAAQMGHSWQACTLIVPALPAPVLEPVSKPLPEHRVAPWQIGLLEPKFSPTLIFSPARPPIALVTLALTV